MKRVKNGSYSTTLTKKFEKEGGSSSTKNVANWEAAAASCVEAVLAQAKLRVGISRHKLVCLDISYNHSLWSDIRLTTDLRNPNTHRNSARVRAAGWAAALAPERAAGVSRCGRTNTS